MPLSGHPLPADVIDALQRGNTIDAIKLLRTSRGMGLKEAKDAVDAYRHGDPDPLPPKTPATSLPDDVALALQRGNKIEAIRLLRERTGLGLKEAKDAVEALPRNSRSLNEGDVPGKVVLTHGATWWLFASCLAGLAAYYFLRGPA